MKRTLKPGTMLYPLPAVLVSGGDMENSTLMTAAWTGIVNSDPPMTYVSIRPERYSYGIIRANGEFVKVYLYLLRLTYSSADAPSLCEIADKLNYTEQDVLRALRYRETERLLVLGYAEDGSLSGNDCVVRNAIYNIKSPMCYNGMVGCSTFGNEHAYIIL